MSWFYLIIAGCFEILGVVLLNQLARTSRWYYIILLALTFVLSFTTLKLAMVSIPMGTAYAIWTGIGTAGGTFIGMLFYQESTHPLRIGFIAVIVAAVIGLRLLG
ncbi:multidrug efflux SMR transporter [Staphylococcus lugdunensis]|uniref:Multidrug efflux SMR transporter n=4 Tax=Staphylococcus TaxID=1279 RepID=A0A133Q4V5_STALU|nr:MULTISPECIES: multidrug efflux SMR transporter [Staphylococcus]AMG62305.1 multidrug resistance protein SMR [Staphylococcus lugdunensis]ARJ10834.1 QacE family quaternary ammonium compound efflux SMR transporter [Staphylococcus lugdunensis]ARJ13359.1 QacE family quaternary ammonium compound efflux SMR transporter [Staphylococcus lugdunensis]AST60711.1 QacE family quaternary ammonium compound efflux SMR transporter [Staphylococcus lugdunensis]ATG68249.1 QacE family quaternary ammonium compound